MKLKEILSISGKSGLYKFVSQGRGGIIVESFDDQSRSLVHASAKVSALEDIAIFTETQEIPLYDVLMKIFEKEGGLETISHKVENNQIKTLFETILPDYDRERVYFSDMKKVVQWYNILLKIGILVPKENETDESLESNEGEAESKLKKTEKAKTTKPTKPKAEKNNTANSKQAVKNTKKMSPNSK